LPSTKSKHLPKAYNLTHSSHRASEINYALMNAHFITVPGLATLTTRSLAGGDAEDFGGHASGSLDGDALLTGLSDDVAAS
jgi:hypothetical protein